MKKQYVKLMEAQQSCDLTSDTLVPILCIILEGGQAIADLKLMLFQGTNLYPNLPESARKLADKIVEAINNPRKKD